MRKIDATAAIAASPGSHVDSWRNPTIRAPRIVSAATCSDSDRSSGVTDGREEFMVLFALRLSQIIMPDIVVFHHSIRPFIRRVRDTAKMKLALFLQLTMRTLRIH